MSEKRESGDRRGSMGGAAFLLAQVGAHAAKLFAERMSEIDLTPAHAGIFRILSTSPGLTQKELAEALGTLPNRIVGMVDELEAKGLIERRVQEQDRRRHALHITEQGQAKMKALGETARRHQATLLAALSEEERAALTATLQRVAEHQGLIPGVHPGYARRWK
ncbi:MarR family winged helix-turn-helix transcriptional regulator [Chelatococcus asaccharovorans]|uniref:MarR family winged helix-turn-helix transcriptional regulator n=1 Tax=Chelatococcus asaccharovorans TaxID=28210 RepID=UPI002264FE86|nr:MarR family transcriptional regulator [Chelatococcus asaccharovorans]